MNIKSLKSERINTFDLSHSYCSLTLKQLNLHNRHCRNIHQYFMMALWAKGVSFTMQPPHPLVAAAPPIAFW